jgi:hypothetical protein
MVSNSEFASLSVKKSIEHRGCVRPEKCLRLVGAAG